MHTWTPRIAEVSRRLRSRADAILGAVWFVPQNDLPALAARAACMGRVPGPVAAALFAPQHPDRVSAAVDEAWRDHDPGTLLEVRLVGATSYLAEALGDDPPGVERAVAILRPVVEGASTAGHPVYAGLRSLPWPATPLGELWRACDMIRERRGGSHLNAWTGAGLQAVELQLLTERWRTTTNPGSTTAHQMGYSADEIAAALAALESRGLVDGGGALTADGREYREGIERATDVQESDVVEALGDDVDELFELMAPWARAVVAAAGRIRS
jgi:hypothetical protein